MYEYENEHRPVENQQSYAYNFSPEPPVHQPEQHPQKKRGGAGIIRPCQSVRRPTTKLSAAR